MTIPGDRAIHGSTDTSQLAQTASSGGAQLEIPQVLNGERLDRVVAALFDCSRSVASQLVNDGQVSLDGAVISSRSVRVRGDQTLGIASIPRTEVALPEPDASMALTVVYEDEDLAVIDKPAGLVVHPAPGHPHATLVNALLARWPHISTVGEPHRPGIVHRLDRGTSGLMCVALSERGYEDMVDLLAHHAVLRSYLALCVGHPEHTKGTIEAPIGRSARNPQRMAVVHDGKDAVTHFSVLERFAHPIPASFVQCELETGRTHQIRVHLKSIGLPILGDEVYGRVRPELGPDRPFLHSARLEFVHPITGEDIGFDSELPGDLAAVLARFEPVID